MLKQRETSLIGSHDHAAPITHGDACPAETPTQATRHPTGAYSILDGTLIPCDRLWTQPGQCPSNWSGKHHREGLNVQAITTPKGVPLWFSPPLPGKTPDLTAAGHHGIIDATAHRLVLAGKAYVGAGPHILTASRDPHLTRSQKQINKNRTKLRNPGERAFAILKSWRIFRHFRPSPNHAHLYLGAINTLICPA